MIIVIQKNTNQVTVQKQTVLRVRIAQFNIPSGIQTNVFSQKGSLLVGTGAGTFLEIPPGPNGEFLQYDSSEPAGVRSSTPVVQVEDTSNHLINGGFDFAQRQTPGTLTTIADGGFGADRWKIYRENAGLQYRRVDASNEAALTSPWYGEFKKITNTGKFLICQILEYADTLKFRGRTVLFQIAMKASAAKNIRMAIGELQSGGTADTIPAVVSSWGGAGTDPTLGANLAVISTPTTQEVTTSWQVFTFSATFPSNAKNLLVMLWSDAGFAADDTLSVAEAGVYVGATARSWTPRPAAQELAICERYFQKTYELDLAPGSSSGGGNCHGYGRDTQFVLPFGHKFRQMMFSIPTVKLYSQTGTADKISLINGTNAGTGTVNASSINQTGFSLVSDSSSGFAAGTLYRFNYTAEAEL